MAMSFRLKDFDGPLDLLLQLISKQQMNIRDIFISDITDQYIEFVHSAPDMNMEEASEFLVMAATLLEIKSRALLPKPPVVGTEEIDPEEELIRRLEEYQRMKESAQRMKDFETIAKNMFTKLPDEFPLPPQETELVGLTLDGLAEAFRRMWARKPANAIEEEPNHYARRPIHRDEHSVEGCMVELLHAFRDRDGELTFEDAMAGARTKEAAVTYFLAILELIKLGEMHVRQEGVCGEIVLIKGQAEQLEEEEET